MDEKKFTAHGMYAQNPKWDQCISRAKENLYNRTDDIRTEFYRDYTRVLHSQPYSRLKHKTQVFYATQNDHICTRMEHVHHVASVSYTIAKQLGLNTELTQAIAISHDIGHAPFGHEGETRLKKISKNVLKEEFWHEKNGLYVVDKVATIPDINNMHKNFNLTYAVRDGIICHCGEIDQEVLSPRSDAIDLETINTPGEFSPYTWEGCVVKISDKIAYLGRDIQDALELGILDMKGLLALKKIISEHSPSLTVLNNTVLMHKLIVDLCENSSPESGLLLSNDGYNLIKAVKNFNYDYIYNHPNLVAYKKYSALIINSIYKFLKSYYGRYSEMNHKKTLQKYPLLISTFNEWLIKYSDINLRLRKRTHFGNDIIYNIDHKIEYQKSVIDFIAGMTDNFAIKAYNEIIKF